MKTSAVPGSLSSAHFRTQYGSRNHAFSRIEALAVFGCLLALAAVSFPLLANTSTHSNQLGCLNNLRQIGIAFQAWGTDHEDRRPWFVPMSEGGTREHPLRNNAYFHYTVLSNHLSPRFLVDPADPSKRMAQRWDSSPEAGFSNPNFRNNAVSYMLGAHATAAAVGEILSGDRHVGFSGFELCSYGFVSAARLSSGIEFRGWTNGLHGVAGNLLFNDGRAELVSQRRFMQVLGDPDDFISPAHLLTPF